MPSKKKLIEYIITHKLGIGSPKPHHRLEAELYLDENYSKVLKEYQGAGSIRNASYWYKRADGLVEKDKKRLKRKPRRRK